MAKNLLLKIWPETGESFTYKLENGSLTLGRAQGNEIVILDKNISRYHAKVIVGGDRVVLRDLESTNGILVNGTYMKGSIELKNGDEFFIGKTCVMLIDDPAQKVALTSDSSVLEDEDFLARSLDILDDEFEGALSVTKTIEKSQIEKVHQENSRFRLLFKVSRVLNTMRTPEDVCNAVVDLLFKTYRPNRIIIMKRLLDTGELLPAAMHFMRGENFEINKEIVDKVANERVSVMTHIGPDKSKIALCSPLWIQDSVTGLLFMESSQKPLPTSWDLDTLTTIANQTAISLKNISLYHELLSAKDNLTRENIELKSEMLQKYSFNEIIGESTPMKEVFNNMHKVLATDSTVLILGESGTGKELVAKTIHYNGKRKDRPFVAINCAAIPDNLLEAELFGIEKGVATGVDRRIGRFEESENGTIFLDEIGEISMSMQVKLLRVLENKEISRVGSGISRPVNIRILAATNANLLDKIKEGTFREDLYYRLNVIPIFLPPLRERKRDIKLLVDSFIKRYCRREKKKIKGLHSDTWEKLLAYDWPGNVRELNNEIERLVVLSEEDTVIKSHDLSPKLQEADSLEFSDDVISEKGLKDIVDKEIEKLERRIILQALEKTANNKVQTAKLLQLSREGLRKKMIRYGLD